MRRRLAILLLAGGSLLAASRDFWRFETSGDFLSGESRGVSVGPDGQVRLAPLVRELHAPEQPFIWRVVMTQSDTLVAGGDGMLLRIRGDVVEPLAESREGGIHAVAAADDGAVFYAASPGGAIHRIGRDGRRSILHDPEVGYVWGLAAEPGGSLLAATGSPASLIRIQPSGQATPIFRSPEEHVTALHRAPDGAIFLGTAPSGIVFRIDPAGDAMALFDSEQTEIGRIVTNAAGEVFATALAESAGSGPSAAAPDLPAPPGGPAGVTATVTTFSAFRAPTSLGVPAGAAPSGGTNALYRIEANGAAEAIWESTEERPLALALLRDERLLLGTGDRGRIYRISRDGDRTLLLRIESEQVTAAAAVGERIVLGASNPSRVLAVGPGAGTEGSYQSRVLDAGGAAAFGRIAWDSRAPADTTILVETRTGNSEEPDDTWSDWRSAANGSAVESPPARFFQWRATLRSDGSASPELVSLTAAWLAANRRPSVTGVTIHPPGAGFEQLQTPQPVRVQGMADPLEPTEAGRRATSDSLGFVGSGRRIYHPGLQTITFESSDPNDDRLVHAVAIRRVGEVAWTPLADRLRERVFAWDTSGLPDGRFELRVTADDSRDNPLGDALAGERVSRPFMVDNTPPVVSDLAVAADGSLRFAASDGASPIRRATAAVAGGPPQVIRPADGISDSLSERYEARLDGFAAGSAVVVRVEDDLGNWVTAEARAEP